MTQWTAPRTWVHAEQPPASTWNTHVRDNLLHLKENLNAAAGFFRGLVIRTHPDADKATTKVQLQRLDQATLDDGLGVSDWGSITADITTSGANGLDTGSEAASTWYQVYGIHNSTSGATALLLHQAKDFYLDETYDSDDTQIPIIYSTGTHTAVAQGFQVDTAGPVEFIDVELIQGGAIAGNGWLWAEIQSDNGGVPSGTVLATSDVLDGSLIAGNVEWVRFVFRSPVTVAAATQYHLVLTGDWTAHDVNYIAWRSDATAPTYANGAMSRKEAGTWVAYSGNDQSFKIYVTRNDTSVTMPSGYDGKVLLGYVYNTSGSDLRPFLAWDRDVIPLAQTDIGSPSGSGVVPILVDMSAHVPPTQVKFQFWLRNGAADASSDIRVGPVPDGYFLGPGSRGQARLTTGTSTVQLGRSFEPIITETQALYVRAGAGSIDALITGEYRWI